MAHFEIIRALVNFKYENFGSKNNSIKTAFILILYCLNFACFCLKNVGVDIVVAITFVQVFIPNP